MEVCACPVSLTAGSINRKSLPVPEWRAIGCYLVLHFTTILGNLEALGLADIPPCGLLLEHNGWTEPSLAVEPLLELSWARVMEPDTHAVQDFRKCGALSRELESMHVELC